MMTIPAHILDAYWTEAKPGTEAALERVIDLAQTDYSIATDQARKLAIHMHRKFYPEITQWNAVSDMVGILYQIDNMTTGLEREGNARRTPTSFTWTHEMTAIWPAEYRPTMSGLLAIWEAMQGAAVYASGSKPLAARPADDWKPAK